MKIILKYVQWLIFWLTTCLPLALVAAAQDFPFTEPEFETLRDAETIDNQPITALAQDARGLIWIGTQTGLVRYDGYRLRKFAHTAGDPSSLAGDYVLALSVANDGRLWVGTVSDGISVFDPATERFEHFRHDDKVPDSLTDGRIGDMINDGRGGMWIATDHGLDHLLAGSRRFVHFRHSLDPHSLMNDKVRSLLLDKSGRLWVGSSGGLQRLAPDGKSFETVVSGSNVYSLFEAQDGKLWLGTGKHGAGWLGDGMPPSTPPQVHWLPLAQLSHPWIIGFAQVQPDQILLASAGGGMMVVAASDGHILQTLRHDPVLAGSLALDALKPLLLDRSGWLWVGTLGAGMQRTNTNNTMLRLLRHSPKRPNGLSHPNVRSLLELADGSLLIGSKGNGIDIFDRQRGLIGGYRANPGQTGALPDSTVYALAQTRDGSVWAGTQLAGVVRQIPGSLAWVSVPGLPSQQVPRLLASRDGSLWAGTDRGVARWRPGTPPQSASQAGAADGSKGQSKPSMQFEVLTDERGKPMESLVIALAEDGQGRIWIGTTNGLWLYEPGRNGVIRIAADPTRPDGLVSDFISGLLVDRDDRLWVATDKGLERLQSRDGKLARFEHISALLGRSGQALGENLQQDRQGRIWTEAVMIDPVGSGPGKLRMTTLTRSDGMDIGSTWLGSTTQTRDGLLLFGGAQGVAIIDPARFKAYDYAPPLVVTELKINGAAVVPEMMIRPPPPAGSSRATSRAASLKLDPAQRNFAIEFAALDYSEPRKNRYQYRLLGYDKDWINTDADHRSAAYGNLWPGRYTLQVRGSNRLGEWSVHELGIPIQVLPAWWQTWWFGMMLLLGLVGFIAALVQTRTRYLRRRQRRLARLVEARTAELIQAQGQLVQQEKMVALGSLVVGIAHEINTPLGTTLVAISGVGEALKTLKTALASGSPSKSLLAATTEEGLEYNALALKTGTRAAELVAMFKTISVDAESDQRVEIELADYLQEMADLVQSQLTQKGCKLEVSAPAGLRIRLVVEALTEALSRILVNALDHGFADGRSGTLRLCAQVEAAQGGDVVVISVSDDGHGIAPEALPKVFDPFFTTKSGLHGHVGLGLHVAYNHVTQRLKGQIHIASTLGQGTSVEIRLKNQGVPGKA